MKPNILFLLIDSLRYDVCYEKNRTSITPNLDSLMHQGTIFTQAISQASITIPSMSSIFSGKYPFESTTLENDFFNTVKNIDNFVTDLKNLGYSTNAIIPESLKHTNFSNFFSKIDTFDSFATLYDNVGEQIINKIKNFQTSPWFLYVHLEDLHGHAIFHLQDGPKNFNNQKFGKNPYARMLSAMDPWFEKINDVLDLENTVLIISADHGSTSADFTEEMHEFSLNSAKIRDSKPSTKFKISHKLVSKFPDTLTPIRKKLANLYTNSRNKKIEKKLVSKLNEIELLGLNPYQKRLLKKSVVYPRDCYDENFRPALILLGSHIPKNKIIHLQIGLIDIFPTIFDLLKLNISFSNSGKSFLRLINGENFDERPLMLDSASRLSESKYSDTIGMRTSKFKYFRDRHEKTKNVHLYNLQNDPLELNNISEKNPEIVEQLELSLMKISPTNDFSFEKISTSPENEDERAKDILKKLGYIN